MGNYGIPPARGRIFCVLCLAMVAGCAKKPEDIAPAYVSRSEYGLYDCAQLNAEAEALSRRLESVTGQQRSAASSDAGLTALSVILFWPAAFWIGNGDKGPELAELKGRAEALEEAGNARGCGVAQPRMVPVPLTGLAPAPGLPAAAAVPVAQPGPAGSPYVEVPRGQAAAMEAAGWKPVSPDRVLPPR